MFLLFSWLFCFWRRQDFMSSVNQSDKSNQTMKQDIVVTRIIDAPLETVWRAWTDPEYVMLWWGPKDYVSISCKIDLREGDKYVFAMRAPKDQGGQESYSAGVYTNIVPLERLEFTQSISDKDGNKIDPTEIGIPADFPKELRMTVIFKRYRCDMTMLTVTEHDWPTSQMFVYSIAGLNQSIDKLAKSLAEA
jgi:uncharacterized protein YndB with AHSA1/START domain